MNAPFFSVIIPTYNRAHFVVKAIDSVKNQLFDDFEIIVVDDGSTDKTKFIIKEIYSKDCTYYYQDNGERSKARNAGIDLAKGKYLCFLDSDDLYCPEHLKELYSFLRDKEFPVSMLHTDYQYFGNNVSLSTFCPQSAVNQYVFFLRNPIIPSCVCIHREILKKFKFDERIKVVEDTVLWINIATRYPIYHVRNSSVKYMLHENNSVHLSNNAFAHRLHGLKRLFRELKDTKVIPKHIRQDEISNCYYGIAKYYYNKHSFFGIMRSLLQSFIANPWSVHNKAKLFMIKSYLIGPRINNF